MRFMQLERAFRQWFSLPILTALVLGCSAVRAADVAVPDDLKSWQGWVLHGEEFRRCPFFANRSPEQLAQSAHEFVCAWPERLTLSVNTRGGQFTQRWQVFAESWITLPGNNEHWPRAVRLNGVAAPVVSHQGMPSLRLGPGVYSINGAFQWSARPEQVAIPSQTGIVELNVDGRAVAQPERPDGAVWLGKRRSAEQQQQLSMQVYRLVKDDVPAMLTTQIRLQVAGEAREELLGKALPDNFVPMAINSLLPARIEADGALRLQLRPGQWTITIEARGANIAKDFTAPVSQQVAEEVWSYQANDRLRVTAVEGVESIDPAQANVPGEWHGFPAYRMSKDAVLKVVERSRGLENQDANQLTLNRQLWLDFEHGGYTVVDTIGGTMRQAWRLDMAEPFRVMSARIGAESLLVTAGASAELSGIELRQPTLNLQTAGRLTHASGRMPATGWQARFANVSGQLNLPPGHHLLTAFGEVDAPTSWTARWRLLDFFIVLIVAVSAWKLRSIAFGVLALAALVLNHHEQPTIAWLMINLLIAVALVKVAPPGRLQTLMSWYRTASLAVIVLVFVPFAIEQVRLGIYPQLEVAYSDSMFTAAKLEVPAPMAEAEMMEAAAPAPAEAVSDSSRRDYARKTFSKVALQQVTQRYAPGTVVQSGPGVPNWRFNSYPYSWSGPVDVNENVRFVIASPLWMFCWRVLGVLLLGAFLAGVAQMAFQATRIKAMTGLFFKKNASAAMVALCLFASLFATQPTQAAATPDAALLSELKVRLTQPPVCAPRCAETLSAQVTVTADKLDMTLEIAALANVAVPIPVAVGRWEPESIVVDGQSAGALYRDAQQSYWVALKSGAHTLRMSGRLAAAESIQLVFPQIPHAIVAGGSGWEFSGISDGRLLTNALELVRQRSTGSTDKLSAAAQFAPFVRVKRYVRFDLDWNVTTVIERVAPEKGAFTVEIPLLKDESVLTSGLTPRDKDGTRVVVVGLTAGERETSWSSALPRATAMELTALSAVDRTEFWSFTVSPMWNVRFVGVPQVSPLGDGNAALWAFEYFPRANEVLKLDIARPEAVVGQTLTFDSAQLTSDVGRRSTNTTLQLSYRSTQGGRHVIVLPANAQVMSVLADGVAVPVRPQDGELPISLLPGAHQVAVQWQSDSGASLRTQAPAVDLNASASNITTQLNIGAERWVLFARGQGVGPAILYWGELLVFIVIAVLLGRYTESPLRTHDWLLLGLGLSTFSWSVLLVFAVWIFAMRWRATAQIELSDTQFNLRQIGMAALSIIAVGGLVSAIPTGLLRQPDMSVRSPSGGFTWFVDQTQSLLPQASVYTVPLIVYKIAILLWALWLSFALLRWLPWGWQSFSANGLWRGRIAKITP